MLDLGFLSDIERIFQAVPEVRHTMLFSATMPAPIVALARRFMSRPVHIRATDPDEGLMQANIKHHVFRAHSLDKDEVIARILQAEGRGKTVIFTRTKRAAAKLVEELKDRGFNAAAVHGDLNQEQRERAMAAFKAGKHDVLIATDVAARGIDVDDVTHVINHTIPDDPDTYLHRAGRTGRAGKTGIAVTFVDWDDLHKWTLIDKALEFGIPEPVETYSSSPHLFEELDIPAGTKGRLPGTSSHAATAGASAQRSGTARPPREARESRESSDSRPRRRTRPGGSDRPAASAPESKPEAQSTGPDSTDGEAAATKRRRRRRRRGAGAGDEATASSPQPASDGE
jgi:superfamily II DNA/RNA helicase